MGLSAGGVVGVLGAGGEVGEEGDGDDVGELGVGELWLESLVRLRMGVIGRMGEGEGDCVVAVFGDW